MNTSHNRTFCYHAIGAIIAVLAIAGARAQVPAPDSIFPAAPTTQGGFPSGQYIVSRLDMARAYLELDRLFSSARDLPAEERTKINRAFDEATILFFRGRHSQAMSLLHAQTEAVERFQKVVATPDSRSVRALRVRLSPFVAQQQRPSPLRIKISPLYALPTDAPVRLRLVIRAVQTGPATAPAKPIVERELVVEPSGMTPVITMQQPDAAVGEYRVELVTADGRAFDAGRWYVADRSLELERRANDRELARIRSGSEQLARAVEAVMSRNAMLSDQLSETESAKFLVNPLQLAAELKQEIRQLQADLDPFVDRPGDYWRTFRVGSLLVPTRVYAPRQIESGKPMPVVIALHGAGGDEALFMDAYGGGAIKRLADEHGFIVVAPSTYFMMTAPDPVAGLLRGLSFSYLCDQKRIYLVGHSLGAITAESFAVQHAERLAAVALLAGATPFPEGRKMSPALLIGAELDPLLKAEDLKRHAEAARRAGLPVEFRQLNGLGHTLMISDALPQAIEWLLKHP